jgi:crossover junction endodeoxyribonuclease RuvC
MRVLGVDPGAYGALALIVDGKLDSVLDMPILMIRRGTSDKAEVDGYTLADTIRQLSPDIAYIEQVGGLPGQSAPAAFNFGRAAGAIEFTAKALGVRVELVPPATWKKALKINNGKDGSRAAAMRLWPAKADSFKRVKDDGRAEAALIAEFGRLKQGGKTNVFG